jgi:hypothetical protein
MTGQQVAIETEAWVDDCPGHRPVWIDADKTAMPGALSWYGFWRCTCGRVSSTMLARLRTHADWIRDHGEAPLCWPCANGRHEQCHEYARGMSAVGRTWGEELRRTWNAAEEWGSDHPLCACPVVLPPRRRPGARLTRRGRWILATLLEHGQHWIASYGSTQHAELIPMRGGTPIGTTYRLLTDLFDAGLLDIGHLEPIPADTRRGRPCTITTNGTEAIR